MSTYKFERLRVLVVDDNAHMRRMLLSIVRAFGVTAVYEAQNGAQAWERLRQFQPDIVFLDWVMPVMDGLEFMTLARSSPDSPNPFVPIIMVSGHTSEDHVRQARDAGSTEFLAKPISAKSVLARMTTVIESPRSFVRTDEYFGPCRRRRAVETYQGPERRGAGASGNASIAKKHAQSDCRGAA